MSILPGWFPGGMAAAEGLTTIVKQAHSSASDMAATVTAPADIIAGDLLIMVDFSFGAYSPPTAVTPSNWNNVLNLTTGTKSRGMIHWKLANGSEASSVITGMNGSTGFSSKLIVVFRGDIPATLITTSTMNSEATTGNPASQNVAASGGTPPLVVMGFYMASAAVDPRTMSPAKDGEVAPADNGNWLAWKIYNTSPANVSVDMDDEGSNLLASTYFQMA
jgi:hypothetical protein